MTLKHSWLGTDSGVAWKDMSILGRPAGEAMILDNSPTSYMFQPEQVNVRATVTIESNSKCRFLLIRFGLGHRPQG